MSEERFTMLKEKTSQLFQDSAVFMKESGYEEVAEAFLCWQGNLEKRNFLSVAIGEAKRGKSSFLTALLEEAGIFPIDLDICTNVTTLVRYGDKEKIKVAVLKKADDKNGGARYEEKRIDISREEIPAYVGEQGNPGNLKNVRYLYVETPNPRLKEGLVFCDTPGVGGRNEAHTEITYGFLPNADTLLFIFDTDAPLTKPELEFIEKGYGFCKDVLFIMTKSDQATQDVIEEHMRFSREKIYSVIGVEKRPEDGLPLEAIRIFPVSNLLKLKYLKNSDADMLDRSNFPTFESAFWRLIADRQSKVVILPFLEDLLAKLRSQEKSLQERYDDLCSGGETSALAEKLKEKVLEWNKLSKQKTEWQTRFEIAFNHLKVDMDAELDSKQNEIVQEMRELIDKKGKKQKIEIFWQTANNRIGAIVLDQKKALEEEIAALIETQKNMLGLTSKERLTKTDEPNQQDEPPATKQSELQHPLTVIEASKTVMQCQRDLLKIDGVANKIKRIGREVQQDGLAFGGTGLIIGGMLGAAAGSCFAPGLGTLMGAEVGAKVGGAVGATVGMLYGTFTALIGNTREDIQKLRMALEGDIRVTIRELQRRFGEALSASRLLIRKEIQTEIDTKLRQMQDEIRTLKALLASKNRELPALKSKIAQELQQIQALCARAEEIKRSVNQSSVPTGERSQPEQTGDAPLGCADYSFLAEAEDAM